MDDDRIVTWARAGGRSRLYKGVIYENRERVWVCDCKGSHVSQGEARACAEAHDGARQPVTLEQCITELADALPGEQRAKLVQP